MDHNITISVDTTEAEAKIDAFAAKVDALIGKLEKCTGLCSSCALSVEVTGTFKASGDVLADVLRTRDYRRMRTA